MNPDQKKTLAKLHRVKYLTRQKVLAKMTVEEREAVTDPCPGEAHKNPLIDGCGCCVHTTWGRVLKPISLPVEIDTAWLREIVGHAKAKGWAKEDVTALLHMAWDE